MLRNANHPIILLGKVLAVAALCVAIWFLAQAFVQTDDTASGVIRHPPEKETPQYQIFPTPVPDKPRDPKPLR